MFFGEATDAQSAHRLLNLAAEQGVNVFDTAEMYPVPQSAQHQGQSEITLGNWLKTQPRCNVSICIHVRKAWVWLLLTVQFHCIHCNQPLCCAAADAPASTIASSTLLECIRDNKTQDKIEQQPWSRLTVGRTALLPLKLQGHQHRWNGFEAGPHP